MTYINEAQDVGVETRLVVYEDFGHGASKPRERC